MLVDIGGNDPFLVVIIIVGAAVFFVTLLFAYLTLLNKKINELRKDIQYSISPKFMEISPEGNELIELGIEVWRLENRINKILPSIQENQKKNLEISINKLKRYLEKNDIEIIDYTNKKYNEGRNLDVLAVEKDPKISEPIIKETKEPTIMWKGEVVRKGKIIVLTKE